MPKKITTKQPEQNEKPTGGIVKDRSISEEMRESYLDYAMSVIIARALPDVRDGLKPVHRRILYAMWNMGLRSSAKFRKSAAVVGEVLGKYHPHGDQAVYESMVRMAQDFSMRYQLVWGQGNFGCFTKDTKIKLTDGRNLNFEELIKEYQKGKKNYTYTINRLGLIAISEIKKPRLTRKKAEIIKVVLDNGAEIKCTPNHLFMMRDESYKEAQNLKHKDSLMPLYQKNSEQTDRVNREGYTLIYQNKKDEWVPVHHLADNYNLNIKKYTKNIGRVRHHINFNKLNNNPDNIIRMDWKDHWQIHYKQASSLHKNKEYCKKIAEGRKKYWSDPANRTKHAKYLSERNIKNWQDPVYREKMTVFLSAMNKQYIQDHPERRKELSKRATKTLKRLWKNPEYRALMHKKIIKGNKNHTTNKTGKLKFINICKEVINKYTVLSEKNYIKTRNKVYPYGSAPLWETGLNKYFQNDTELVRHEINGNHKVLKIEKISKKEDVYDLTINGTHNFCLAAGVFVHNSMDGDSAAAQRYTEAKLKKISEELLSDIDKDTVDFSPNYDGSQQEPKVLPAKLPTLLLNGTMGIAVGMSTNIPPHNLTELIDGIIHLIDNSDAGVDDLMQFIKGPDFPTGGIIYNKEDIKQAYATGKGGVVLRGKTDIEETKKGFQIIISEIPYQMNKASFLEKIAGLVKDKKIEGIRDLRDESNKDGVRVVVELKKDSYPKKILNQLFSQTGLQTTFHFNVLALVDGIQPRVLTLKMVLEEYIKHRQNVVTRRTQFELNKAKDRAHILEGLMLALNKIDSVIKTIKASKDRNEAKIKLIKKFKLSEKQAEAILEMKLSQLANLEKLKIETELKDKQKFIKQLTDLLKSPSKILKVIKDELMGIKEKFGDERRTKIIAHAVGSFNQEDLIPNESAIIVVTGDGYIKRLPPETFKTQGRGGKGVIGLTTKEEDVVEHLFTTSTHEDLLFFTTKGRVFQLKAYEVPVSSRTAKGQSIVNFLQLAPQEKVSSVLHLPKKHDFKYLTMVTRKGTIKKCKLEDFNNIRRSGLIAIKLKGEDLLEWVKPVSEKEEIMIISADGKSIRFKEKDIRCMGRSAGGVRGIRLKANDMVVGMGIITEDKKEAGTKILIVTANGFGKMTDIKQHRLQSRGGSGIKTAKVTSKNGKIVWAYISNLDKLSEIISGDLLIISDKGQVIRLPLKSVPNTGRDTQGVRLMRFKEKDDRVASVTLV